MYTNNIADLLVSSHISAFCEQDGPERIAQWTGTTAQIIHVVVVLHASINWTTSNVNATPDTKVTRL